MFDVFVRAHQRPDATVTTLLDEAAEQWPLWIAAGHTSWEVVREELAAAWYRAHPFPPLPPK